MEEFFFYICHHVHNAPWILFCLLLLTGLCIPISEDILLLSGGAIASACIPEHAKTIYVWLFLGSYLAAWEAYWIGRLLGPKLYQVYYFRSIVTPHRLERLRHYYAKFGVFTFIIGRFCPGGIRNALFISSGLTKIPFYLFALRDGCACLISTITLFFLGYQFGQNFDLIVSYFYRYTHWFFIVCLFLFFVGFIYLYFRKRR